MPGVTIDLRLCMAIIIAEFLTDLSDTDSMVLNARKDISSYWEELPAFGFNGFTKSTI